MDLAYWFSIFSNMAMLGWLLLMIFPWRKRWVYILTGMVIPALMGLAYAVLIIPNFTSVDGGGYGSLEQVSILFSNKHILLAGWVHYLAFDLAVGTFIARESDKIGLSRLIQLPILFLTFMFGPLGYLIFLTLKSVNSGAGLFFKGTSS